MMLSEGGGLETVVPCSIKTKNLSRCWLDHAQRGTQPRQCTRKEQPSDKLLPTVFQSIFRVPFSTAPRLCLKQSALRELQLFGPSHSTRGNIVSTQFFRTAMLLFPAKQLALSFSKKARQRKQGSIAFDARRNQYRTYQHHLHQAIDRQNQAGKYTAVVLVDYGEPLIHTLANFVNIARQIVTPNNLFPHLLSGVKCVVALGGLSECGKSTTATALVYRHNQRSASAFSMLELGRQSGSFRMKTIYLEGLATARMGKSVYLLGPTQWALEVVHELDNFARIHKYLEFITIESMHNLEFAKRLQELIGSAVPKGEETWSRMSDNSFPPPKLLLVYLDTPLALRMSRTNAQGGGAIFDETKDGVKKARGAHQIKDIADLVCENVGTQEETCEEIEKAINSFLVKAA